MSQQRRQKQSPIKTGSYPPSPSLPLIRLTSTLWMVSYQKLNGKPYQSANSTQPKVGRKELLYCLTDNRPGSITTSQVWPRLLARTRRITCNVFFLESRESDTHLFQFYGSKILLYISSMLAFRQAMFQKALDKDKLYERLGSVPTVVADSLLSRFAEMARGSSRYF